MIFQNKVEQDAQMSQHVYKHNIDTHTNKRAHTNKVTNQDVRYRYLIEERVRSRSVWFTLMLETLDANL